MIIWIFIWIGGLSFAAMAGMIGWQILALRGGRVAVDGSASIAATIQPQVDHVAFHISAFCVSMLKHSYVKILEWLRVVLLIAKFVIIRVEKRFAKIINTVKGKGVVTKRGSVSLFLKEVEQYRLEVRSVTENEE